MHCRSIVIIGADTFKSPDFLRSHAQCPCIFVSPAIQKTRSLIVLSRLQTPWRPTSKRSKWSANSLRYCCCETKNLGRAPRSIRGEDPRGPVSDQVCGWNSRLSIYTKPTCKKPWGFVHFWVMLVGGGECTESPGRMVRAACSYSTIAVSLKFCANKNVYVGNQNTWRYLFSMCCKTFYFM